MKTVLLYGELGNRYGRRHRLAVKTPAEAIRAFCANFPSFQKDLVDSEKQGIGFRVLNGTSELTDVRQVKDPASDTIKIIPAVIGAGGPVERIFIGAALIAVSFFIPPVAGAFVAGVAFNAGVALTIGGVSQLISPPPASTGPQERPENQPSYIFNGPVNTVASGHPVPIGYGRMIVGGAVISAGISNEQQKQGQKRVQTIGTIQLYASPGVTRSAILNKAYTTFYYDIDFFISATAPLNFTDAVLVGTPSGKTLWEFTYPLWTLVDI